ncbi:hypothetical protein PZN02_001897 [Sinorhizobium garamanticum]|uniref:Uncharacterized protein n=1 Tax=Sinorhizobium garamanticum TaxID=680247 RepID=A0ABY8DEL4_9HYPH|nr:hypothetical protein [Sinorhizobium garamanticum]WEX89331.1 hypothetical protein PZN02_001897 [Sinorhizobium garamanticum]
MKKRLFLIPFRVAVADPANYFPFLYTVAALSSVCRRRFGLIDRDSVGE